MQLTAFHYEDLAVLVQEAGGGEEKLPAVNIHNNCGAKNRKDTSVHVLKK
jgi:hypothetical protein